MFIKQESHVSHSVDIKLIFDDEVKDVSIKEGMYATFQYIRNGETRTISGLVSRIGYEDSKPYHEKGRDDRNYYHRHHHSYDPYNGHDCNPLFFEQETVRPVPSTNPNCPGGPYHLNNHSVYEAQLDGRQYFIEVDSTNAYNQRRDRIFVPSIINITVIYDECQPIVSPKGMDQVPFIRLCNGLLQYSMNGLQWYNIDGSDADEQRNAVNRAIVDIADNRTYILQLQEEVKTLKAIIESLGISIPDPTPSDPSDPSGGDNTDPENPSGVETEDPTPGDGENTEPVNPGDSEDTEDPGTGAEETDPGQSETENPSDTETDGNEENTGV